MDGDPVDGRFVHTAFSYRSDEQFLAMALPFVKEGLSDGEPVVALTTAHNIALLRDTLGELAVRLHTDDTAHAGRRQVDHAAVFLSCWNRHRRPGYRMRMLAEPVWHGRPDDQFAEWKRMEAGLNVLLAGADLWMVFPYDTRSVSADILVAARATHHTAVDGMGLAPAPEYAEPRPFAAAHQQVRNPEGPAAADAGPTRDAAEVRAFARGQATAAGLCGDAVAVVALVLHEAASYLLEGVDDGAADGGGGVRVQVWREPGALVWELRRSGDGGQETQAVPGFLAACEPADQDRLWLTRTLCRSVDVRSERGGVRLRLRTADTTVAEHP